MLITISALLACSADREAPARQRAVAATPAVATVPSFATAADFPGLPTPLPAAIRGVAGETPLGPYAATEAGLVDVNCRLRGGSAAGTGIVLESDGVVVTNNHVVARAISISATNLVDGRRYPAVVVLRDTDHDVAVLRLIGAARLPVAPLADSDQLLVGDRVTALGNAGGRGGPPTVTTGAVVALDQSIVSSDDSTDQAQRLHGMIEVSAPMPAGDSGGALLGTAGVVGMNTAEGPHSGFAIPIKTVLAVARTAEDRAMSR
jgi:S1-C subfamily serine protease